MDALPIEDVRAEFVDAMETGRPVIVAAPTGSGKSTRLGVWLLEQVGVGRVWVVEPRRIACRALARWVASGRGQGVGQEVGYRVRFDDRLGPGTRLGYVTPGVALNLWAAGRIGPDDVVIVDEFHERGWEVDLVTALILHARRGPDPAPRLVLCSATLDGTGLRDRLQAILIESRGRSFAVTLEHRGPPIPSPDDLETRVAEAVADAVRGGAEDVLVFVPGKAEIERCAREVERVASGRQIVPVHGGLPPRALAAALQGSSGRRVYLATNVAETSLTLPGVDTVVDGGLARSRVHRGGRSVLALGPISASSMEQRAGRAGRVRPGRCIRLWAEHFVPEPFTAPEVERIELDELVLRASACGVSGPALDRLPFVTPLPAFALAEARARLTRRGALDAQAEPTPLGRSQAQLPVSWFGARILADAPPSLRPVLADLVAILEIGRSLILEGTGPEQAPFLAGAPDEVRAHLRCLRGADPKLHGVHASALAEARALSRTLGGTLDHEQDPSPSDDRALVAHLLRTVPEAASVPRPRASKATRRTGGSHRDGPGERSGARPWSNGEIELWVRDWVAPGTPEDARPKPPEAGLILEHEWLGMGRSARGVGRMVLRCEPSDLEAAGRYETRVGSPAREGSPPVVVAVVERVHAGVVLSRRTEPVTDAALCTAVAELVVQGRMRRGLAQHLEDRLHAWRLCEGWLRAGARRRASSRPPRMLVATSRRGSRPSGCESPRIWRWSKTTISCPRSRPARIEPGSRSASFGRCSKIFRVAGSSRAAAATSRSTSGRDG